MVFLKISVVGCLLGGFIHAMDHPLSDDPKNQSSTHHASIINVDNLQKNQVNQDPKIVSDVTNSIQQAYKIIVGANTLTPDQISGTIANQLTNLLNELDGTQVSLKNALSSLQTVVGQPHLSTDSIQERLGHPSACTTIITGKTNLADVIGGDAHDLSQRLGCLAKFIGVTDQTSDSLETRLLYIKGFVNTGVKAFVDPSHSEVDIITGINLVWNLGQNLNSIVGVPGSANDTTLTRLGSGTAANLPGSNDIASLIGGTATDISSRINDIAGLLEVTGMASLSAQIGTATTAGTNLSSAGGLAGKIGGANNDLTSMLEAVSAKVGATGASLDAQIGDPKKATNITNATSIQQMIGGDIDDIATMLDKILGMVGIPDGTSDTTLSLTARLQALLGIVGD